MTTKITQTQVFLNSEEGKLKGFARVCVNDELMLTGLRIYEGTNGLFVAYPNDPNYKGDNYKQLFYPVSRGLREHIEEEVLGEYEREIRQ